MKKAFAGLRSRLPLAPTVVVALLAVGAMGCGNIGWSKITGHHEPDLLWQSEPAYQPQVESRDWPERIAAYQNSAITHDVLYLEDPFELIGNNDGQFGAWSEDDALAATSGPFILVANMVTWPITAVAQPPWQQESSRDITPVQEPIYELPYTSTYLIRDNPEKWYWLGLKDGR